MIMAKHKKKHKISKYSDKEKKKDTRKKFKIQIQYDESCESLLELEECVDDEFELEAEAEAEE